MDLDEGAVQRVGDARRLGLEPCGPGGGMRIDADVHDAPFDG